MTGMVGALKAWLTKRREHARKRKFLDASMAASALLALADGEISFAELMARDYVLDRLRELHVFAPNEAAEAFRTYAQALQADTRTGKARALSAVQELTSDPELGMRLIRICLTIAKADRDFNAQERAVIAELCQVLGLDPSVATSQSKLDKQGAA